MIILFEEWLKRLPNLGIPAGAKVGYRTGIVFAATSLQLEW